MERVPGQFIKRLLGHGDHWDRVFVYMVGRQPLGIERANTEITFHPQDKPEDDFITVKDNEGQDPTYDPRIDGPQPRVCEFTVTAKVSSILFIDYIKYPKIIGGTGSKLVGV